MRVFLPTKSGGKSLCKTDEVMQRGTVVQVVFDVGGFDHKKKLALKIHDNSDRYLLIEEIDDEISELAHEWSSHQGYQGPFSYMENKKVVTECIKKLDVLLSRYLTLIARVSFEEKGPGVSVNLVI